MTASKRTPARTARRDAPAPSSRPKQARGLRTRAKIITAASEVMDTVGYANTTTKAIAEAAGVAEGTIYRHFEHKHELMLAVILDRNKEVVESIQELPALAGTATVADHLANAMRSLGSLRADLLPLELETLGQREIRQGEVVDVTAEEGLFGPDHLIAEYLRREQDLGRLPRDLDPDLSATLILAALFGVAVTPASNDPDKYRNLLDHAIEIITVGLTATRQGPR